MNRPYTPLSLTVPEPEFRPGDKPEFAYTALDKAGTVRRPEVDEKPENIRDMAFSIIRVIDRQGEADGTLGRPAFRGGTAQGPAGHDDLARL